MKFFKRSLILFFLMLQSITFAGQIYCEKGYYYYYDKDNEKTCSRCNGNGKSFYKGKILHKKESYNYQDRANETLCEFCRGTEKQKRFVDFRSKKKKKSKKIYKACSIINFEFPYITIKHMTGIKKIHLRQLSKTDFRYIYDMVRVDDKNNYYVLHGKIMPALDKSNSLLHIEVDRFIKVPVTGKYRIKLQKDKKGNFYFNRKFVIIRKKFQLFCENEKINIINLKENLQKIRKSKFLFLRIVETPYTRARKREKLKTTLAFKSNNFIEEEAEQSDTAKAKKWTSESFGEYDAVILLQPDRSTVFKILKNQLNYSKEFPKLKSPVLQKKSEEKSKNSEDNKVSNETKQ